MISVIFDMDGTLLDTQKICIPAWETAGKRQGFDGLGEEIPKVCGMNQVGWTGHLKRVCPELDVELFVKDARDYIAENLVVRFKKGGEELLKFLKENGIKVGVASGSNTAIVNHHLSEVNATELVDVIVGGEQVENGKPAPDIFLQTAKLLGAAPENCIVFEDSPNGIKAAVGAGMRCIGIPDVAEFSEETKKLLYAEVNSMDEAIEILEV